MHSSPVPLAAWATLLVLQLMAIGAVVYLINREYKRRRDLLGAPPAPKPAPRARVERVPMKILELYKTRGMFGRDVFWATFELYIPGYKPARATWEVSPRDYVSMRGVEGQPGTMLVCLCDGKAYPPGAVDELNGGI